VMPFLQWCILFQTVIMCEGISDWQMIEQQL
jgi:hypothetical protein